MVPRLNDLVKIVQALRDETMNDVDLSDIEIVFSVDPGLMQKLNEDFYYRNGGKESDVEHADEICVNVGGIPFRYIPKPAK